MKLKYIEVKGDGGYYSGLHFWNIDHWEKVKTVKCDLDTYSSEVKKKPEGDK